MHKIFIIIITEELNNEGGKIIKYVKRHTITSNPSH